MARRIVKVCGVVQGVGFRPFVHRLAEGLGLGGFVRNDNGQVLMEIEGSEASLDRFLEQLGQRPPPLAVIEKVAWAACAERGERQFHVAPSTAGDPSQVFIPPDVATCRACLGELLDPGNRRFRYPFLNCTDCGPRLTVIRASPYDRQRTTMSGFAMCEACRLEYENPSDRRFHAEPTACATCGPRARLLDDSGVEISTGDPVRAAGALLRAGRIGAVKGLGGYHLACDARSPAVAELRRRKRREQKPFAVMVANVQEAERLCLLNDAERALLCSPRAPIVLLRKRAACDVANTVAPGNPSLGVMLPCTPLHHLLFVETGFGPVVMTSGNRSDEPIAIDENDALARLAGIADFFLVHDRPVHVRCDDSVVRVIDSHALPVRRSRGYAPEPVRLPAPCPRPMLAVGGQLKATFCLGRGPHGFVSHHLGDLDELSALNAFERDIELYQEVFVTRPEIVVHDLHPDYASTRYAKQRAAAGGVVIMAVQHHHAHMASCMAEHGLEGPVIGVTFDGTGYGTDGTVWGGEVLVGGYGDYVRAAHLRPVPMPGGARAIRQPWRMAAAHLRDAGLSPSRLEGGVPGMAIRTVQRMMERGVNCPRTTSAGRLFDAAAAIAGVRLEADYEGQAAMELEWLAESAATAAPYPFEIAGETADGPLIIDTRPLIRAMAADAAGGVSQAGMACRFHVSVAHIIAGTCRLLGAATGIGTVVLSGGVFVNAVLTRETSRLLRRIGLRVYRHETVPPNDGGLSLGQLAVAAARVGAGR